MSKETKAQHIDGLKNKLKKGKRRVAAAEEIMEQLKATLREHSSEKKLCDELRVAQAWTEDLERELLESNTELTKTAEQLAALREHGSDPSEVVTNLQIPLEELHDAVECKQSTINQLQKDIELEVMRAKEKLC